MSEISVIDNYIYSGQIIDSLDTNPKIYFSDTGIILIDSNKKIKVFGKITTETSIDSINILGNINNIINITPEPQIRYNIGNYIIPEFHNNDVEIDAVAIVGIPINSYNIDHDDINKFIQFASTEPLGQGTLIHSIKVEPTVPNDQLLFGQSIFVYFYSDDLINHNRWYLNNGFHFFEYELNINTIQLNVAKETNQFKLSNSYYSSNLKVKQLVNNATTLDTSSLTNIPVTEDNNYIIVDEPFVMESFVFEPDDMQNRSKIMIFVGNNPLTRLSNYD